MSTLDKRLTDLERSRQTGNGPMLILRRCVKPDRPGAPSDIATFGPHTLHRASDETEAVFTARVEVAAREHYGRKHGIVILMTEDDAAL